MIKAGANRKFCSSLLGVFTFTILTLYQSTRLVKTPSFSKLTTNNASIRPPDPSLDATKKFISYKIVRDLPLLNLYDPVGSCASHIFTEPFKAPGVMDFHTSVETNLNILYVGDSVGTQFAQILQEATHPIKRQTIRYSYCCIHETSHMAATPGGGTVAGIRVTGLMTNKGRDRAGWMPPSGGGGWYTKDVREMKRLIHQWRPVETNVGMMREKSSCEQEMEPTNASSTEDYSCEQDDFDVVVHHFSPGWLGDFENVITWDVIDEMVNTAFDYFGATTVVLQTIQIMNNVKTLDQLFKVNNLIWKYARDFQAKQAGTESTSRTRTKRKVLVMDTFAYTFSMYLQNSMAIGIVPDDTGTRLQQQLRESTEYDTYLNLTMSMKDVFNSTVTKVVTKKGIPLTGKHGLLFADLNLSIKSLTSSDGQHWCTKATGGRINAALACLLRCSFGNEYDESSITDKMKDCEWRCNKQYMSLAPVPWDDAEEIKMNISTVDLKNKEIFIKTNSTPALVNY